MCTETRSSQNISRTCEYLNSFVAILHVFFAGRRLHPIGHLVLGHAPRLSVIMVTLCDDAGHHSTLCQVHFDPEILRPITTMKLYDKTKETQKRIIQSFRIKASVRDKGRNKTNRHMDEYRSRFVYDGFREAYNNICSANDYV